MHAVPYICLQCLPALVAVRVPMFAGSDSDYSYKSFVSAGGTRHVTRRRKRADGTYSAAESYHSSQDPDGRARRQKRRAVRKAAAVKIEKARMAKVSTFRFCSLAGSNNANDE